MIKGTETEKNLLKAFAGESQARSRYMRFASTAKKEGYEQIAAIFQETADNEYQHASQFFKKLEGGPVEITATYPAGKVGTTLENLEQAAEGENEEHTKLYPDFARVAMEEGLADIAKLFEDIATIEKHHEDRFRQLYNNVKSETVFKKSEKRNWICRVCGYEVYDNEPPHICPVCAHPQAHYQLKVENY